MGGAIDDTPVDAAALEHDATRASRVTRALPTYAATVAAVLGLA